MNRREERCVVCRKEAATYCDECTQDVPLCYSLTCKRAHYYQHKN